MRRPPTFMRFSLGYVVSAALLGPVFGHAATFGVNTEIDGVDTNPGDGICETAESLCSLRAAVQEANAIPSIHTIVVPSGTYSLTLVNSSDNDSSGGDLDVTGGDITIQGADSATTLLDGNMTTRIFEIGLGATVRLENLTLQNGAEVDGDGGAILSHGTLTVDNLRIVANTAGDQGGGIYHDGSTLEVINSLISDNAAYQGGGLYIATGTTAVLASSVSNNLASYGAGIYNLGGSLRLESSGINQNAADADGGGIFNEGNLDLYLVEIATNSANTAGAGLFLAPDGSVAADRSTIRSNVLNQNDSKGSGVYAATSTTVRLSAVSIVENSINKPTTSGTSFGGGVYFLGDSSEFSNVTVSKNLADIGGGLYSNGETITMQNSTFASNMGGNVFLDASSIAPTLRNTIVDNPVGGTNCAGLVLPTSLGHNIDNDETCHFVADGDINSSAGLGSLDPTSHLHPLIDGSPAIDSGDNISCPETDGAFSARNDGACDIGSFEAGAVLANPGILSFSVESVTSNENDGTVSVTVKRTVGSDLSVSVDYSTLDGTAFEGSDYLPVSGTFEWAHGDATDRTITVTLLDNSVVDADRIFSIELSNVGGGAAVDMSITTVTIVNDDIEDDTSDPIEDPPAEDPTAEDPATEEPPGASHPVKELHPCNNGRGDGQGRCHKQGGGSFDLLLSLMAISLYFKRYRGRSDRQSQGTRSFAVR